MSERIDHAAEALALSDVADDYLKRIDGKPMSDAQAVTSQLAAVNANMRSQMFATLAFVEQQRIANLIAVMAMALQGVGAGEHSKDEYVRLHQKINPQVMEGLGL